MTREDLQDTADKIVDSLKQQPGLMLVLVLFTAILGFTVWQQYDSNQTISAYVLKGRDQQTALIERLLDELIACGHERGTK